jgi:hypothetical protein
LLSNGNVLITGGVWHETTILASAEIYNPVTGISVATGDMTTARSEHTATLLDDGKVLVAGGFPSTTVDLYDPTTGVFATGATMVVPREGQAATLLTNSKVLMAGGGDFSVNSQVLSSAELYDPTAAEFTATGSMTAARYAPTATLLPSGKVLIAGGSDDSSGMATALASAELYE